MAKVHKSLRIEAELAERVTALRDGEEAEAATYNRVIAAGVDALGKPQAEAQETESGALVDSLSDHIETLKRQNAELSSQLRIKDEQLEALTTITKQAQTLQAIETHKAIEAPKQEAQAVEVEQVEKRGFWARLFG